MNYETLFEEIKSLKNTTEKVYIYGFGSYGQNLYQILKSKGIFVDGFVITNLLNNKYEHELAVYSASDFFDKEVGYILAMNTLNTKGVEKYLQENRVESKYIVNAGKYIEQYGERRGTRVGSVEITTVMGCSVNCRYCPQDVLLQRYFEKNKKRIREMSLDTFKKILDVFPSDYDVSFGGFSEPFFSENFIDMLKIACEKKKHVSIYTTLAGAKREEVEEMLKLPISFVVLHVADKYGYAHIALTEEYYESVEKLIYAKKADGTPFVNLCNAQAEPDERIKKICENKYEIFTVMTDRAGNLQDNNLISNHFNGGKIICENLGNYVVLPDGSVVLCCMDFGLKHVLGNIHENTFEEIVNGDEMERVKEGMEGRAHLDILCRNCSYARRIE